MRYFNYLKLMELSLPVSVYHTIAAIHEYNEKIKQIGSGRSTKYIKKQS